MRRAAHRGAARRIGELRAVPSLPFPHRCLRLMSAVYLNVPDSLLRPCHMDCSSSVSKPSIPEMETQRRRPVCSTRYKSGVIAGTGPEAAERLPILESRRGGRRSVYVIVVERGPYVGLL